MAIPCLYYYHLLSGAPRTSSSNLDCSFQIQMISQVLILLVLDVLLASSAINALRGAHPANLTNTQSTITCIPRDNPSAKPLTLPKSHINDDYCDCLNGEDEPGTSACPNGAFWCANADHKPIKIASSHVDDGVCDCCDGSDEPSGVCPDTCAQDAALSLAKARAAAQAIRDGAIKRAKYAAEAKCRKATDEKELRRLERELRSVEADMKVSASREEALKMRKEHEDRIRTATDLPEKPERMDLGDDLSQDESRNSANDPGRASSNDDHSHGDIEDDNKDDYDEDDDDTDDEDDEYDAKYEEFKEESKDSVKADVELEQDTDSREEKDVEDGTKSKGDQDNDDSTFQDDDEDMERVIKEEKESGLNDDNIDDGPVDLKGDEDSVPEFTTASSDVEAPAEITPTIDVDSVCAELGSKGPNAIVRSIIYLRAVFIAKLRRVLPSTIQGNANSFSQDIDDCLQKAQSAKWDLESKKRDLDEKISKLKAKAEIDYGLDGALRKLHGSCTKKKIGQYEFEHCPFDLVKQYEHGSAIATLGRFSSWEGEGSGRKMSYPGGDHCWNGPARSITVELVCGRTEDIISVDEPNRCAYSMKFETPAVCDEEAAKALLAEFEPSRDGAKDEL